MGIHAGPARRHVVRLGASLLAVGMFAACSGDDGGASGSGTATTTTAAPSGETTTTAGEPDEGSATDQAVLDEARRITDLASAGLVWSAKDSDIASTDIVEQTAWRGPTEPVPSDGSSRNVQVIMCAAGTACEVAANFVVEAAETLGWTAEIIDGQFNPEVWLTSFDTAISRSPDAIIGIAIPDVAVDAKLAAAREAGIVTVSIADTPEGNTANPYDAYVSYRMPLMHQVLAHAVIAETNGEADVILINDSAFPNLVESNAQFQRVMDGCAGCSVTLVDWQTADALDPVRTEAVVTAALNANSSADFVVMPYSIGMPSVIEAVRKAGRADSVDVVAKDGDAVALSIVAAGQSPFNAGVGLDWVAYAGIDQVARGVSGLDFVPAEETGLGVHLWTTADTPADGSADYSQWLDFKAEYARLWGLD